MKRIYIFIITIIFSVNLFCQKIDLQVVLDSVYCRNHVNDTAIPFLLYHHESKDSIITDSSYSNHKSCVELIVCKTDKELLKCARQDIHKEIPVIEFSLSKEKINDLDNTIVKYNFDQLHLYYKEFGKYKRMSYNGGFSVLFKKESNRWKIYKIIYSGAY